MKNLLLSAFILLCLTTAGQTNFKIDSFQVEIDSLKLEARFTTPLNKENYPLIILIGGSGPTDVDGTLGPNKFLKSLAHELGKKGIATLRVAKRTYQNKLRRGQANSIENEYTRDLVAAYSQLKVKFKPQHKSLFLLGHSLGGHILPAVSTKFPESKGIIMMAANYRPLEDLIYEQLTYVFGQDSISPTEKLQLAAIKTQIDLVKSDTLKRSTPLQMLPFGVPGEYWLDLKNYAPIKTIEHLKTTHVLLLQGERDYQVTKLDFKLWKQAFDAQNVNQSVYRRWLKLYPSLNHIFCSGKGKATPMEYFSVCEIDAQVIEIISIFTSSLNK